MKKLLNICDDKELLLGLLECTDDESLSKLGFDCKGHLCEEEGYEEVNERFWLYVKETPEGVYTVGAFDIGNTNCEVILTNIKTRDYK